MEKKIKIDGYINIYDSNNDYFNNICSKITSKSGTDYNLNNWRNNFLDNNISLCEKNYELIEYNYIKEKA